ncbi:MAG: hypothetical protein M3159_05750 [Actinomycetota bacterium]|nr:hypothetical protein [Actinomycetota bacterium]
MTNERPRSKLFWPLALLGWLVMTYAIRGIFMHSRDTNPSQLFRLLVGLDLVHDLVLAPLVIAAGYGLTKLVPARVRPPVTAGLFVSAAVVLYSYPLVRGFGRFAAFNSSRLPNNYATGLVVVLAAIWVVTGVLVAVRLRRHQSRHQSRRHQSRQ